MPQSLSDKLRELRWESDMGKKKKSGRKKKSSSGRNPGKGTGSKGQKLQDKKTEGGEREQIKSVTAEEKDQSDFEKIPWKKLLAVAGSTLFLATAGVYVGGAVYFQDKFFPNTTVNGIRADYCTVEEVENTLADKLKEYRIVLKERAGARETIRAEQIGYRYVSTGEVEAFMEKQNPWTWPVSGWREYREKFSSSAEFDKKLLRETVGGLNCFSSKVEQAPRDAYMEFHKTTYRIVKESEGKKVKKKRLLKVLGRAVLEGKREIDLEETDCYEEPSVRKGDKRLNRLKRNLNQYAKTSVTYSFGEARETLDGSRIKDWLSWDEEGNVTLDESMIPAYVAELAQRYDTYNKPRKFKTHDGSYVEVEGGRYGWKIDQEAEAAELLELVRTGTKTERQAVFAQTAVSWENSDLGHSYVEIDLTGQHLWMYIDGVEEVSSDFVSGDMSRGNRRTPPGTFTLYYKTSPAVLRSNTPGDSYESPVTYWMPFNGGIGLHDANWRGSFGGNIYKYNGSHGCINLPTGKAREIYRRIEKGFPIICYYR